MPYPAAMTTADLDRHNGRDDDADMDIGSAAKKILLMCMEALLALPAAKGVALDNAIMDAHDKVSAAHLLVINSEV